MNKQTWAGIGIVVACCAMVFLTFASIFNSIDKAQIAKESNHRVWEYCQAFRVTHLIILKDIETYKFSSDKGVEAVSRNVISTALLNQYNIITKIWQEVPKPVFVQYVHDIIRTKDDLNLGILEQTKHIDTYALTLSVGEFCND